MMAKVYIGFTVLFAVVFGFMAAASIPACPTEDSTGCYWDASTQGNGNGRSFVAITDDFIIYIGE